MPGTTAACACSDGAQGAHICKSDGSGYFDCGCVTSPSSTVTAGSSSGSGSSGGSGSSSGVGSDSGGSDGGAGAIPSCASSGPGTDTCPAGTGSESCCTSLEVPGGTFSRAYTNAGSAPTGEASPATVSGFRLDKYLVTVGRFRSFVEAWNGGAGYMPAAGSGVHAYLSGGEGLANSGSAGTYEPGWSSSWDSDVAPTNTNLACSSTYATWTDTAGSRESLPINCVNWYEAYAFCIWDGGFLPSEAEWEYAAAAGDQQREYPWGSTAPGASNQYAIYGSGLTECYYPTGTLAACTGVANIAPVGTAALGAGMWGHLDLAGELWEWTLDTGALSTGGSVASTYVDPCDDCSDLATAPGRVMRGGIFADRSLYLLPASTYNATPTQRSYGGGVRCARAP
jgi:sulfatase modifying factor 1